ncbi:hypothetical protein GCM10023186_16120 [Hymenobacter koreensis]|uniref:DUF2029 domain-containing protein n=1 Tax=Hymenobacter koreensis TaxID=1084523 RepID=A0ABP8IY86_9BACT
MALTFPLGHRSDVGYWTDWASHMHRHGLGSIYQRSDNSYNPLYHYLLWLYGEAAGSLENIRQYRHYLKLLVLPFDVAGALLAASLVPERNRRFGCVLLLLLNLGYVYNTLVWQQIDAIYTFFAFAAVVAALRQRPVISLLAFVLALNTKTQAVIFLPPLLLLWLPLWFRQPITLAKAIGAAALVQLLLLAPFIWGPSGNYLGTIIRNNLQATSFLPTVSQNAFNFWHLLLHRPDINSISDSVEFAGLSYRAWGLLLFCFASFLTLLPLLLLTLRQLRFRVEPPVSYPQMVLLSCGVIPILFAFFNTQMHERYWHAAILFLAAHAFLSRRYTIYVLASVAYLLNLEAILGAFHPLGQDFLVFKPRVVALLFVGVMLLAGKENLRNWRRIFKAIC